MKPIASANDRVAVWHDAELHGWQLPGPHDYAQGQPVKNDRVNPRAKDEARTEIDWKPKDDPQDALPGMESGPKGFDPAALHRGLVINLRHPGAQRVRRMLFPSDHPVWQQDVHPDLPDQRGLFGDDAHEDRSQLGNAILDYIESYHDNRRGDPALKASLPWTGRHWTNDPEVAREFAFKGHDTPNLLSVHLQGQWDGRGEDPERSHTGGPFPGEKEITMLPGAGMKITHVNVEHPDTPGEWQNVLHEPSERTASRHTAAEEGDEYDTVTGHIVTPGHHEFETPIGTFTAKHRRWHGDEMRWYLYPPHSQAQGLSDPRPIRFLETLQQARGLILQLVGRTASRTAMPAPMPEGMTFHYHPTRETVPNYIPRSQFSVPGVEARHNGTTTGWLCWARGSRHPGGMSVGEIKNVYVSHPSRHHGIATALFDFAKQHEPNVHHSDTLSESGRKWRDHEESRHASAPQQASQPKRPTPPWAEHVSGKSYPLQPHPTDHLIDMYYQLKDHHHRGSEPPEGYSPYQDRMQHYVAELLDRHNAGDDPAATKWGLDQSYLQPDYTSDQEWAENPYRPNDPRRATRRRPLEARTDSDSRWFH